VVNIIGRRRIYSLGRSSSGSATTAISHRRPPDPTSIMELEKSWVGNIELYDDHRAEIGMFVFFICDYRPL
jgi:hypothetical protein